jgi:predicted nucleic acid-binding protein
LKLLADTSGLVAFFNRNDVYHGEARRWLKQTPQARFLLTDLVLAETATRLAARAGAKHAVDVARSLLASERYQVVFVDEPIVRGALEKMAKHADKRLSLADCASFEVIERLSLEGAFTFDRDFRDCGYRMVPAKP